MADNEKRGCLGIAAALVAIAAGIAGIVLVDDPWLKLRALFGSYPAPRLADLRPDPRAGPNGPRPYLVRLRNPSHEAAIIDAIRFEVEPAQLGEPGDIYHFKKVMASAGGDPLSILPAPTIDEDVAPPCRYGAYLRPLAYPLRLAPKATGLVRVDITPRRIDEAEACFVRIRFQSDHGTSNALPWVFPFIRPPPANPAGAPAAATIPPGAH
jgi:hypothetical protein